MVRTRSFKRAARMAGLLPRLPAYRAFRTFDWPTIKPLALSFVVTDKCNSLCKTCNIGRRYLQDPSVARGELHFDEYARLFRTFGRPRWVTLSGGEPFMRKDFPDIAAELARTAGPAVINVPTNGTFVNATASGVERILRDLGSTGLIVNVSVDGLGEFHDEVRGFRNNFNLLLETIERLRSLGDERLTIGVNTVVSRFNVTQIEGIVDFVHDQLRPDSFVVETAQIRPEYYNESEELAADRDELRRALDRVLTRVKAEPRRGMARLVKAFRIRYYEDVRRTLGHPRPHRCFSGFSTCSIMPKGDVWSSTERGDPMGNVRDYSCNFEALWMSRQAREVRARVRAEDCYCETSNVSYSNALLDPAAMARVLWYYVRYP